MPQINAASNLITYTLVEDKQSLVNLLERNGVRMPNNPTDNEITVAVLASSAKSPNFKTELADLLTTKAVEVQKTFSSFVGDSSDFGFTGIDDLGFTGIDDFVGVINYDSRLIPNKKQIKELQKKEKKAGRVSETNPKGKTGFGQFLQNLGKTATSKDTINSGINVGLTALNNRVASKQNEIQAQAALITSQQDEAKRAIAAQKGGGSNILLIVGVLVVVGVIGYFSFKKK